MQHCLEPTHPMTLQAPLHAPHQLPNHAFAQHPDGADALAPPQLPQPPHSASAPHSLPHIAHIVSTAAGLTHATLLGAANAPTLVPNLAQAFAGNRLQTLDSNMSTVSHFKALPRTDSPTSWTSLMRGRRQPAAILPAAQPTNSRTAAAAAPAALSRPQQPLSGPLPQQLMSHQQDLQHQHPPGHLQGDSAALQSTDSEIVSGSSVGATPGRLLG